MRACSGDQRSASCLAAPATLHGSPDTKHYSTTVGVGRRANAPPQAQKSWRTGACSGYRAQDFPLCRSEEHTSELQSLMRISYAVFCLKKKNKDDTNETRE